MKKNRICSIAFKNSDANALLIQVFRFFSSFNELVL
jgi:hypothetical protein